MSKILRLREERRGEKTLMDEQGERRAESDMTGSS